ncbi:MarR family transcriptional regulator [Mumia sp. zg.B53]|uniref:MarR family winged helix-turn-helix transcriptional regulator n=1 Tax=unclassified Mumia TaxID=2621872 RepID=UPI001C6F2E38|nr:MULTISPECIES: MarR family transcriptional regulator [unclassified Mumia]MBW9205138.1 MarR family transcriptional regulator [Mumia sp. zg.B17]MBW9208859.1 MarR family transcriptional regulator [Mumia sp. zg.B21]MBW9213470.1 MarR family transcriptional regulator [Mumia sp. zg.B53]MDD9347958.1 MarR family transcriptional regulator [Mumia sp.]
MTTIPDQAFAGVEHDVEYEVTRLLRRSRLRGLGTINRIHPDLDFASYMLLVAIVDARPGGGHGVRGSDLADAVSVHKSTVSRGIAQLEQLGLVERVPDPTDGRARLISLTEVARERLAEVRATRRARLARAIADWTEDDLDTLASLLGRLNTGLEAPTE